ncbi:MAG: universal stress protein [Desulfovibrionales bacterium]|nr:MAG: universal stress protein [Desulfovibrionales bacterium]
MVEMRKILCAIDFSEVSPMVAGYANSLAKAFGAEVILLYSAPSLNQYVSFHVPPNSIETFVGEIVSGAEQSMEAFISQYLPDINVTGRVVSGYAAEEIVKCADEENVDMVVMGTHGRKGIDRILFGSVAEKVVKSANCPVLTLRPFCPVDFPGK